MVIFIITAHLISRHKVHVVGKHHIHKLAVHLKISGNSEDKKKQQ